MDRKREHAPEKAWSSGKLAEGENLDKTLLEFDPGPSR
jgi:hypothetical protein